MDIQSLRVFVDVVRFGSFAAVARQQGVDPSSISRIIAVLEADLGFVLFQRTTRRLAPTEAGTLFFNRVQPIIEDLESSAQEARDILVEPTGRLRVTASVSFGTAVLVPLLPRLKGVHPGLSVDLVLTDAVVDLVAENIDLAIRLGPRRDSGLIGTELVETRYRVCVSPGYLSAAPKLAHPRDLKHHSCVVYPAPGDRPLWRFRHQRGGFMEVPITVGYSISNSMGMHRAAREGLGPTLLPDWLIGDDVRTGNLIDPFADHDVTDSEFEMSAWLLYPSRAYVPRKLRAMIDFLKRNITVEHSSKSG
jgi:DNA-binding transcriptional LysR family regulator